MLTIKATSEKKRAYRCKACNSVQKENGSCEKCGSAEMNPMFIHFIKPKEVISTTKGAIK